MRKVRRLFSVSFPLASPKCCLFIGFPYVSLYRPDGVEVFLNHAVYFVHRGLKPAVHGSGFADDEKQDASQNRHAHQKHQSQPDIHEESQQTVP